MRLWPALAAACAALLAAAAGTASASSGIRYGIQDDAWLLHGPGELTDRLDRLEALQPDVVRFNLRWNLIEAEQGAPDWTDPDTVLQGLRDRGIPAVVAIVGTPAWANGGRGPNYAPTRAADVAAFARAAATRYRFVRDWLIWNEPNQVRWLRPTTPAVYVTRLLNPAYAAIHAVNRGARVAGGVTAPRANAGGVSPVDWIRGMRRAGARLDAYAHHPYPARPSDSPFSGGCAHCTTITMATLERLLREVGTAWGGKRVWLTEYAYQTNPPDRFSGVTLSRQARLLGEAALRAYRAPRVDMLIHYLIRDEPSLGGWQSGLYTLTMRAKPAVRGFSLPLAVAGRSGGAAVVWGQIRAGSGARTYRVQTRLPGGAWTWAGGARRTTSRGFVSARVTVPKGASVRVWSADEDAFSIAVPGAVRAAPRGPSARSLGWRNVLEPPVIRGGLAARLTSLVLGLFLCACGVVAFLEAGLGLPPWDVLHQGVAERTPLSFGEANLAVSLAVLGVAALARARIGLGTVLNAVLIGGFVIVLTSLDTVEQLSEASLAGRVALLAGALGLFGAGSALYIAPDLGAGPRDSLMLVLSRRLHVRIGVSRTGLELAALAAGWALGGTVGIGTLVFAAGIGPAVELAFRLLARTPLVAAPVASPA
jgi:uncharacterized membrane protein YczE